MWLLVSLPVYHRHFWLQYKKSGPSKAIDQRCTKWHFRVSAQTDRWIHIQTRIKPLGLTTFSFSRRSLDARSLLSIASHRIASHRIPLSPNWFSSNSLLLGLATTEQTRQTDKQTDSLMTDSIVVSPPGFALLTYHSFLFVTGIPWSTIPFSLSLSLSLNSFLCDFRVISPVTEIVV